jgi:acetyl-CoA carboxylase biotin carboxyl carrier protein
MKLSGREIAEIARLLDASHFTDLELETGDFRLRIRRGAGRGPLRREPRDAEPAATIGEQTIAPDSTAPAEPPAEGEVDIPAPLLGTFYHSPRPGDPPFVATGDAIGADRVIGIIEVMKLMNPIHAGVAGIVVAHLAPNACHVEAGQALIRVRRAG